MSNQLTRMKKRKLREKDKGIIDFVRMQNHFFPKLIEELGEVEDPRKENYTEYTSEELLYPIILKNSCTVETMRQMTEWFGDANCASNLGKLIGRKIENIAHYDTINNFLEKLEISELNNVKVGMVKRLIRNKSFYQARMRENQWIVILDGTGLYHFREKHCENCLVKEIIDKEGNKKKVYYHNVLEAKIIIAENIVISLGTEFIENESEDVDKQDCEINASKRLLKRIKEEFPKLKICILGDSLYAVESIIDICKDSDWNYLLRCKEGRQKNLIMDYRYVLESGEYGEKKNILEEEKGTAKYVNHVEEITGKDFTANIFEYEYEQISKRTNKKNTVKFQWITDIELTNRNIEEMVKCGRKRWKIENEGFNTQKNILYKIEHLNSKNPNAMKNHYLLTQITDILMQLYLAGTKVLKELKQAIKNTSSRLLETFRRAIVTDEDVSYIKKYTTVHFT
ncbi:transposase family protein [Sedimentibacter sp.]|uniref:transposase family protein n=1 Tax=Sedimentibacter sp. TaxID=1960295 RepID=UPI0028AE8622|nr:transposase family protein [Sedimentibacter sp.]